MPLALLLFSLDMDFGEIAWAAIEARWKDRLDADQQQRYLRMAEGVLATRADRPPKPIVADLPRIPVSVGGVWTEPAHGGDLIVNARLTCTAEDAAKLKATIEGLIELK